MAKQMYTLYDKKSFLKHMAKAIPDDLLIVTSNVLDSAEVRKKLSSIKISQLHAQEFFNDSDGVGFVMRQTIPISMLLCEKEAITKEYQQKLKEHKGMTGFSV